jgi:hypothetical protein
MYHLDMSVYAFEKLADKKWGEYSKAVQCSAVP